MKKNFGIIIAIVVGIVAIALIYTMMRSAPAATPDMGDMSSMNSGNSSKSASTTGSDVVLSGEVKVDIKNFDFETKKLRIKPGTKVTWTNQDDAKHDIMPDSGNFDGSGKLLAHGESYSYTFNAPGTYAYHCTPHPYMKASVEVVE